MASDWQATQNDAGVGQWVARAQPMLQETGDRLNRLRHTAERWIKQRPELALGFALCTGVVLGWLVKRR